MKTTPETLKKNNPYLSVNWNVSTDGLLPVRISAEYQTYKDLPHTVIAELGNGHNSPYDFSQLIQLAKLMAAAPTFLVQLFNLAQSVEKLIGSQSSKDTNPSELENLKSQIELVNHTLELFRAGDQVDYVTVVNQLKKTSSETNNVNDHEPITQ